jgi:hypothetical protein
MANEPGVLGVCTDPEDTVHSVFLLKIVLIDLGLRVVSWMMRRGNGD